MNEPSFAGFEMKLNAIYAAEPRDGFVQGLEKQLLSPRTAKTHFWQWWVRDLRQSRQVRLAWTAVVILLLAACVLATPQGRAWAQTVVHSFLGYFSVTDKTSLPLAETPRPLPTYSVEPALLPFEPKTTPAADPARCGATLTWLTATPRCQLLNVQDEARFDLKVFAMTDISLRIEGVSFFQNFAHITYFSDDGTQSFRLWQGLGDFPPLGVVHADALKQVTVGNHPAELVVGQFANFVGKSTSNWDTWLPPVQLRWREDDHWYSLSGDRFYWTGDKIQEEQLVQSVMAFAQGLVPLSAETSNLAGNVDQTPEERVGFHILTPATLPEGCDLNGVWFGTQNERLEGTVVVTYGCMKNGQWVSGITLYEALASNKAVDFFQSFTGYYAAMKYDLIQDEMIQIGHASGRYMVRTGDPSLGDSGSTALTWEQDGLKLMLTPTYAEASYGGRYTQTELIAIAESLK